jgi:hypothetical protein
LAITLPVFRSTAFDYPFCIFKTFLQLRGFPIHRL